jgi:hypothetical protein
VLPAAGCRWLSAALAAGKQMVAGCPCFQKEKVADKRSTVHGLYLFYVGNKRKKTLESNRKTFILQDQDALWSTTQEFDMSSHGNSTCDSIGEQ